MNYDFDWSVVVEPAMWLHALGITLGYAAGTIIAGMAIGLLCGTLLLSARWFVRTPVKLYVQFFRCTPSLVQIIWFYYALPILTGFNLSSWVAAGLGLTLYMGAFCTEIFRAGIISIDKGQWEASRALGMSEGALLRHVIIPQAIRRMIPPFVNQCVLQLKNTSLLYVVAVPDLMYTSSELTAKTYRPLEVYTFVALLYLAILAPITALTKRLESRRV